ncbi:MAG: hypothetical protein CVT48_01060, partial [Thermoplasmata archaeon HGW-Thermoplasmata-1]
AACREIKSNPKTKAIPVVMFSALGRESDKKMAKEAGADGYITKPLPADDFLVEKVRSIISEASEAMRSEEKFRKLAENSFDIIATIDENGIVTYVSPSVERIRGFKPEEFVGKSGIAVMGDLKIPDAEKMFKEYMSSLAEGTAIEGLEIPMTKKDGTPLQTEVNVAPVFVNGKFKGIQATMRDVTERKKMEEELRHSEERFRAIAENSFDLIFTVDESLKVTYVSPSIEKMSGYKSEEVVGRNIVDMMQDLGISEPSKIVEETLAAAMGGGETKGMEMSLVRKDGTPAVVEINAMPSIVNGKLMGGQVVVHDLTERKKAEEAIKASEERYRQLVELSPDAVAVHQDGKFVFVNSAGVKLIGAKVPEDIIGKPIMDVVHPDYRDKVGQRVKAIIENGQKVSPIEEKYVRLDGIVIDVDVSSVLTTHRGRPAVQTIIRDVTEKKIAEKVLIEALARREEMENIINRSPVVVFLWRNEEGRPVEYVSDSIRQFGYSTQGMANRQYEKRIHPDDTKRVAAEISDYTKQHLKEFTQKYRLLTKTGETRWVEDRMFVRRDPAGRIIHYQGIVMDITERKKAEKVQAQLEAAKRLSELKTRFVSVATHELRTPLVSVKGYTDLVLSGKAGDVPQKIRDLLDVAARNTDRLLRLVEDLLDVQRIESGRLTIEMQPIDLRDAINHCAGEIKPLVEDKKQKLNLEIPERPLSVNGDGARLEQVFMNILNNASKFTPESGTIAMRAEEAGGDVRVSISDTGMGIRKEDLTRIFEPFADVKKATYIKGTGLGLSVAKGIVEAHGGTIKAESEGEGKGATFTVSIPKISLGGGAKNAEGKGKQEGGNRDKRLEDGGKG